MEKWVRKFKVYEYMKQGYSYVRDPEGNIVRKNNIYLMEKVEPEPEKPKPKRKAKK